MTAQTISARAADEADHDDTDLHGLSFEEFQWSRSSEALASSIQLALVGLLFAIYLISPAPQDRGGELINATMISLAAATLISGFRRLTPTLLTRSFVVSSLVAAIEAAIICYLIYSYHLQYNLPLGAVLKSPTFAYFFVFIALRAFSLRPSRVIVAGGSFAIAWLVLVGLAGFGEQSVGMKTASFSEYVSSSKILVGAEIDKCIAVVLFTLALAFCTARARSLITLMIAQSAQARDVENAARLDEFSRLTGTIAHEIRNPLHVLQSATYVVEKKLASTDADVVSALERIKNNVDRCDHIIARLMEFTRDRDWAPINTAVDMWLSKTVRELSNDAPKTVKIDLELGLSAIRTTFDPDQLKIAVGNLVENAIEALTREDRPAGAQPTLTISSFKSDRGVEISISDNGPGIPKELAGSLQKPLVSSKGFGLGLGIPVAKQIFQQHGGGLEYDTSWQSGTRVVVWLPRKDRQTA